MRRPRLPRLLIIALAMAFMAVGCGDSDNTSTTDTNGDEKTTTTTAKPSKEQDEALAAKAVLQLSDFPPGWTEGEKSEEDSEEDDSGSGMDECFGDEAESIDEKETASADSPEYDRGETTSVESSVSLFSDDKVAKKALSLLASDEGATCFEDAVKGEIAGGEQEEGVTIGEVALKKSSFPTIGDQTVAYQFAIPISGPGVKITVYSQTVFFRKGRGLGSLIFNNFNEPFSGDTAQSLATKMAARLET